MRQAAEDVSADSAVKDEWKIRDEKSLRMYAELLAKKHFPEKEGQDLAEAMMKHLSTKKMYNDWEKKSWLEKRRYMLATMQRLRELPVAASAVKFCSELFREANSKAAKSMSEERNKVEVELRVEKEQRSWGTKLWHHHEDRAKVMASRGVEEDRAKEAAEQEAKKAAKICRKVLTGELGADDGPEWAEKAAKSSQPKGQHYQLGRLQKVNATEKAWKVSLENVCKDECIELVKEMKEKTREIIKDVDAFEKLPSYEELCAKRVVQKVEAEILGCCAESCGWNGRACMYWPFLNSTEKGQWEAECCTEFNILKNSSRATMCDATLTGKENKEVIRDVQPNSKKDREMIGQDPVLKDTSFLQSEDTNGPSPPPENTPIPRHEGTCPPPLDLGKIHEKLKHEWKTTNFQLARKKNFKKEFCLQKKLKDSIGNCTAFLPQDENSTYMCYGHCLVSGEGLKFTNLTAEIPSNSQLLYVHETIYKTNGE